MRTIVVGVDGSAASDAALEFAIEEAALRGASLRIVCAWEIPSSVAVGGVFPTEMFEAFPEEAQDIVNKALARVTELKSSVTSEGRIVEGHPAEVLLKEAEGADLLVVGSRGRGGFGSLLLGSVSQQIVHHATGPVVVVRQPEGVEETKE